MCLNCMTIIFDIQIKYLKFCKILMFARLRNRKKKIDIYSLAGKDQILLVILFTNVEWCDLNVRSSRVWWAWI